MTGQLEHPGIVPVYELDKNDVTLLAGVREEMDALWPATPAMAEEMRSWLQTAGSLIDRRPRHERALARLVAGGNGDLDMASSTRQFWVDRFGRLLEELVEFQRDDPHARTIRHVEARLEFAENISRRSIEVTLDPYFLSKYEMTQAQWERFTGKDPSYWSANNPTASSPTHPVEQVSWNDCARELYHLGLVLPTEAQWERACRAETDSIWSCGNDPSALVQYANLKDGAFTKLFGDEGGIGDFDDGQGPPAEVGHYRPNSFGLHDMHGNVFEWCLDGFGKYDNPPQPGTGERRPSGATFRVNRGGSYRFRAVVARSALRGRDKQVFRHDHLGVRPARSLEP